MAELSEDELLLAELGLSAEPADTGGRTARGERIVAGFEDVVRFVENHGRAPRPGEGLDIFERLYAVRLDRLRAMPEAGELLRELDKYGLLGAEGYALPVTGTADDAVLLEMLGANADDESITVLRHVRSREERATEEMASRIPCRNFSEYKGLFAEVERDLQSGVRQTRRFGRDGSIKEGDFFVLGGQIVYVASVGEETRTPNGENNARLRVIYSNGTESDLLTRSLQRALYKDEAGRRLTDPNPGPLFSDIAEEGDSETGTIYVLRSRSDHPFVAEHRELIHKIGVTGGSVEARIAGAAHDATFLLADVDVVATYKLSNIDRTRLEGIFHKVFAPAQLDLTIPDRFGDPVKPREWFLVPLAAIDEAVSRLKDGTITNMRYEPAQARLVTD